MCLQCREMYDARVPCLQWRLGACNDTGRDNSVGRKERHDSVVKISETLLLVTTQPVETSVDGVIPSFAHFLSRSMEIWNITSLHFEILWNSMNLTKIGVCWLFCDSLQASNYSDSDEIIKILCYGIHLTFRVSGSATYETYVNVRFVTSRRCGHGKNKRKRSRTMLLNDLY